jgi:hypothetical protein
MEQVLKPWINAFPTPRHLAAAYVKFSDAPRLLRTAHDLKDRHPMDHQALKTRHRLERESHHPNLTLRVHRPLSWLNRAEQADDIDGRFIFLWIAFNSAYATDIDEQYRLSEQSTFKAFLDKLCALDTANRIENLVWSEFSGSIRALLDNPFVFQSFWDDQNGKISEQQWTERFCQRSASSAACVGQP